MIYCLISTVNITGPQSVISSRNKLFFGGKQIATLSVTFPNIFRIGSSNIGTSGHFSYNVQAGNRMETSSKAYFNELIIYKIVLYRVSYIICKFELYYVI